MMPLPEARCETSKNSVKAKFNFRECPKGEVRRIPIPRTPVNKAGQASSEALSDYTRGCRIYLRLRGVLLLLVMLAGKVLRTVHNDHHDRHRAPQRCEQPRLPHRVSPREHRADETARDGVVHGVH